MLSSQVTDNRLSLFQDPQGQNTCICLSITPVGLVSSQTKLNRKERSFSKDKNYNYNIIALNSSASILLLPPAVFSYTTAQKFGSGRLLFLNKIILFIQKECIKLIRNGI